MVPSNLVSSGGAQDTGELDNIIFKILLGEFGTKPNIHLTEIFFFLLFYDSVIVWPTKVMLRVDKNWAHF